MTSHNYYPPSIQLPDYVANESSVLSLILQFGILWAAVVGFSFTLICRLRPSLSLSDRVAFTWMCLSIVSPILLDKVQEISPLTRTSWIHPLFLWSPLRSQPCSTLCSPGLVWPALERILSFWFPISDIRCILGQHGSCDCGTWKYSLISRGKCLTGFGYSSFVGDHWLSSSHIVLR